MNEQYDSTPASGDAPLPQSVVTTGERANGIELPDFAFMDFAKKYMGVLATVTAIPAISTVFGVVVPPDGNNKLLPVLTSLTCLVTFAACFQLRDMLSYFVFHRYRALHLVPFALVTLIIACAIPITSGYYVKQVHWATIREQQADAKKFAKPDAPVSTVTKPDSKLASTARPSPTESALNESGAKAGNGISAPSPLPNASRDDVLHQMQTVTVGLVHSLLDVIGGLPHRLLHVTSDVPDWLDVTQYVFIHPLFIMALGIVMVTSFTQIRNVTILTMLESQFSDGDRDRLLQRVKNYVDFDRLAKDVDRNGCSALKQVGKQLTDECDAKLHALSRGCIEVPARETRYVLGLLFQSFHKHGVLRKLLQRKDEDVRFDAVSDRDLDFWTGADDPYTADQYFRLNVQAVCDNVKVSRIFILDDEDVAEPHRRHQLAGVLKRHQDAGIGWAVVLHNEIDPKIRQSTLSNDFGLFNCDEIVSFFRGYRQGNRMSTYVFSTPHNRAFIDSHYEHYLHILSQCWMASEKFCDICQEFDEHSKRSGRDRTATREFRDRLNKKVRSMLKGYDLSFLSDEPSHPDRPAKQHESSNPSQAANVDSRFLITVGENDDMEERLLQLAVLRKVSRELYGEQPDACYDPFHAVVVDRPQDRARLPQGNGAVEASAVTKELRTEYEGSPGETLTDQSRR